MTSLEKSDFPGAPRIWPQIRDTARAASILFPAVKAVTDGRSSHSLATLPVYSLKIQRKNCRNSRGVQLGGGELAWLMQHMNIPPPKPQPLPVWFRFH